MVFCHTPGGPKKEDGGLCRLSLKETQGHPQSSKLPAYLNLNCAKITLTLTLVIELIATAT